MSCNLFVGGGLAFSLQKKNETPVERNIKGTPVLPLLLPTSQGWLLDGRTFALRAGWGSLGNSSEADMWGGGLTRARARDHTHEAVRAAR